MIQVYTSNDIHRIKIYLERGKQRGEWDLADSAAARISVQQAQMNPGMTKEDQLKTHNLEPIVYQWNTINKTTPSRVQLLECKLNLALQIDENSSRRVS